MQINNKHLKIILKKKEENTSQVGECDKLVAKWPKKAIANYGQEIWIWSKQKILTLRRKGEEDRFIINNCYLVNN